MLEENNGIEISAIANDMLVSVAEKAEKRVEAVNKIKRLALKVTNSQDWVDQNGKPYLQASGAEKIARLFGISWRIDEPTCEEEADGHFTYTYKGYFTLGGVTIEAIGSRSSKDGFFKKYQYVDNKRIELPISAIDKGDVKKAAFTNCIGNGITRLLGIRNLAWEDLEEAGIKVSQHVSYTPTEETEEIQKMRNEIWRMLQEMFKENAKLKLKELTSFIPKGKTDPIEGKTDIAQLTGKMVQVTYGKTKELYLKWQKENANADPRH